MKITITTECGEKTCAAKPGKFCRFVRTNYFGTKPICNLYGVYLWDEDGWLIRCEECLKENKGEKSHEWTGDVCPFYDKTECDAKACLLKSTACGFIFHPSSLQVWMTCSYLKNLCPHFRNPYPTQTRNPAAGFVTNCLLDGRPCEDHDALKWQDVDGRGTPCLRMKGEKS